MIVVAAPLYEMRSDGNGNIGYESAGYDDVSECEVHILLAAQRNDYFILNIGMRNVAENNIQTVVSEMHEDYIYTDAEQTIAEYIAQAWRAWAEEKDTDVQFGQGDTV